MIRGAVNTNFEPVIPLRVRDPVGPELDIDAVVDTGFTGSLTLPAATIAALSLPYFNRTSHRLGDGTLCQLDTYSAEVEWDGVWLSIIVAETTGMPLVGTALLAGHEMHVEFRAGGAVDITRLP